MPRAEHANYRGKLTQSLARLGDRPAFSKVLVSVGNRRVP
jgi:hypothetical protein